MREIDPRPGPHMGQVTVSLKSTQGGPTVSTTVVTVFGLHFSETEVLSLPAGYSANSIEGDVGDNQWGGGARRAAHLGPGEEPVSVRPHQSA